MKKYLVTTVAAAALSASAVAANAGGTLSIYNWFDYIPLELLDKFSKEYDVEVTMDTYDSNEAMLAALKAGKMGSYDVAVPSDYMVTIMGQEGLLDTIADGELSNFGNIAPDWLDVSFDKGRKSSIPYQWGSSNFAVLKSVGISDVHTSRLVFNPPEALKGKINMLDSQGEVLALASLYLGIGQCSTDRAQLKQLNDLVVGAKENWASFASDTAKDQLLAGDVSLSMIYSGQAAKARNEGASLDYSFPREGYILFADSIVLLKDAPNRDNAILFMNFMLEPENIAAVSNYAQYGNSITGADKFMDADLARSPELNPPAGSKGHFVEACVQEVQELYDRIWTNVKK